MEDINFFIVPGKIYYEKMEEGALIYNTKKSSFHLMNKTAFYIWELFKDKNSISKATEKAVERYLISKDKAQKEIISLVRNFINLDLLGEVRE